MGQYPQHWEADGLLRDGRPVHLRPIRPDDAQALREFHESLSEETIYFRFFAPYPKLSDRDVKRFSELDYIDRVAIVAELSGELIGVGRYDRVSDAEAEVAFAIADAHQGRGLGSMLLEHLAAAARENGIARFVADVLPSNKRMAATFAEAGFSVTSTMEDGVVHVSFDIEPTDASRAVMESRERRAEAMSVRRLLAPSSVAVVGASRSPGTVGHELLANVVAGGFTGALHAVHPEASSILGVPCVKRLTDIEGPVDVAVIAVNSESVSRVVEDAAAKGVLGLVIISSGFADTDDDGVARQRELVRTARLAGMRIVGPNALGVMNTDPAIQLNASLAAPLAQRGRAGFFCQSGALGSSILLRAAEHQLGLSTFISAGNRADVSGNDVLQYWEEDPATSVVLLYLETIGNPRKFARLTRRIALTKPIVTVRTAGAVSLLPSGHVVRESELSRSAIDSLLAQSGVMQTASLEELFRVATFLSTQPIPHGNRVGVISNSDALAVLAVNAAARHDLGETKTMIMGRAVSQESFEAQLVTMLDDPQVDTVLVLYVPPVESDLDAEIRAGLTAVSRRSTKPMCAVLVTHGDDLHLITSRDSHGSVSHGSIPLFADVEDAVSAISIVSGYALWLAEPRGEWLTYPDIDLDAVEDFVQGCLATTEGESRDLTRAESTELLHLAGIDVLEQTPVVTEVDAVLAGGRLGWPVVLKTTDHRYVGRPELGGVRLSISNEREMCSAFAAITEQLDERATSKLVVQRMADPGVTCAIVASDDPAIGPVVSFSIGGTISELLDDRAHRLAPMTNVDVANMIREIRTAPLLFGYRGAPLADVAAIEDLLGRLGVIIDAISEIDRIMLNPILVSADGARVIEAQVRLRARPADPEVRRLPTVE